MSKDFQNDYQQVYSELLNGSFNHLYPISLEELVIMMYNEDSIRRRLENIPVFSSLTKINHLIFPMVLFDVFYRFKLNKILNIVIKNMLRFTENECIRIASV